MRRMVFTDASTSIERLTVQFAGLPKIMEEYALRVSGCSDIPSTLLWGRSPEGQNATGDADFRNWDETVKTIRRLELDPALRFLTPFLLANAGLRPDTMVRWSWPSVLDKDLKMEAETTESKVRSVLQLLERGVISSDEARAILDGDPVLMDLPGPAPESALDVDAYADALKQLTNGQDSGESG